MQAVVELGEREATLAIETIRAELGRRGKVAVIAVSDSHGEPIALLRMDGAPLPSVDVALRKTLTPHANARRRATSGKASCRTDGSSPTATRASPAGTAGFP